MNSFSALEDRCTLCLIRPYACNYMQEISMRSGEVEVTVEKHSGTWPSRSLHIFRREFYSFFHRPGTVNRACARNLELRETTRSWLASQSGKVRIRQSRPISPVTVAFLTTREPQLSGRSVFPNTMRTRWKTRSIIPGMSGDKFYSSRHSLLRHKLT